MKQPLDLSIPRAFHLTEHFLGPYKTREPDWGPLGYITFKRSYARPTCYLHGTEGSRCEDHPGCGHPLEEWWQTVQRVVEGCYDVQTWHCARNNLLWIPQKAQASAQVMYSLIFRFLFTPPGRGLWMMGTDYVRQRGIASLLNCAFRSTKDIDRDFAAPFTFVMDMLMLGCGVGSDCRGRGKVRIREPRTGRDVHVVEDSREGWIALVERHLNAYVGRDTLPEETDYSEVRDEGAPINGFGGAASGPGPLMELIAGIHRVLRPLIDELITSAAITDLNNFIGKCVVAGGIRRSAEIMFSDPEDEEFMFLKDPTELNALTARLDEVKELLTAGANGSTVQLEVERAGLEERIAAHPLRDRRWASNNSIFARVGMDYSGPAELTGRNGEPNYVWLDTVRRYGRLADLETDTDQDVDGLNPCVEQPLADGECCNLVETYPARHDSYAEYERTVKWAYLYAKTVTLLPHHNRRTNAIMMHKRRIGLSQSGIVQSFARHGRRVHFKWCDQSYGYIQRLDAEYSKWLAIPRSVRTTSVKPSGTVSLLCGATPGIHYAHSEYYIRRIRFTESSPLLTACKAAGYLIERDVYSPRTWVVEFPIHEPLYEVGKEDVSIWEQLENAAQMQHHWADNAVSCTVNFASVDAGQIRRALELYETRLKGVSFLPNEHGYAQAPYETISASEYARRTSKLRPLRISADTRHEATDRFCDGGTCEIPVGQEEGVAPSRG